MDELKLKFDEINYTFPFVFVQGTGEHQFLFGLENDLLRIRIKDFFISKFLVTQVFWRYIMGNDPSCSVNDIKPVENVSYNDLVGEQGFFQKINEKLGEQVSQQLEEPHLVKFRLATETEWEYAARGGIYWGDYFIYSGSDNIDEVGWYRRIGGDESKVVGLKKPNQLGLYDMSGNLWEWCLDYYHEDTTKIPRDGSPCLEESTEQVLRGGCFHNYGMHCTVMKRYQINPEYKDGCIGFRVALSI